MREKVIATLITTIMALSTISPVLAAYDLGDYPSFLFEDHNLNAYVVVGTGASGSTNVAGIAADVVGAVDLAVRLAGESYDEVSATGGIAVAGGEEKDVPLGTDVAGTMGYTFDDADVEGLQDKKLDFADDEWDIHEEIWINDDLHVVVSGEGSTYEEFGDNVALITEDDGAIGYRYYFDDWIDPNDVSTSEILRVDFLGVELEITDVGSDNQSITVRLGEEVALGEADTMTVSGKTLVVGTIGSTKVQITVGTETKFFAEGDTKKVGGLEVYVDSILYTDDPASRRVFLRAGTETGETYGDGESMTLFGEPEDEDDATWVWDIDFNPGSGDQYIGAIHNQQLDEEDEAAPVVGEYYEFPNEWGKIGIAQLTVNDWGTYEIYFDDVDSDDGTWDNENCLIIKYADSTDNEGLEVDIYETKIAYINQTGAIAYLDDDNDIIISDQDSEADGVKLVNEDYTATFRYNGTSQDTAWLEQATDTTDIILDIAATFDGLGTIEEAESTDVAYGSNTVGTSDYDVMTEDGVIIKEPEDNADKDMVVLEIPADVVEATVLIAGPGTTIGEEAGDIIKKVVPITNAVAKLDTEVSLPVSKHLILVGGPAVNRLTAQAMGYTFPTYGSALTEFAQNEGYIKVFEDVLEDGYVAVVAAGWEAKDTRNACSVLQQYATFASKLEGNVAVKVTSVTAAGITAAE